MKCKKIFINILESKDTMQEINDVIGGDDGNNLQGYHIILENKTPDKFSCNFTIQSENEIFWSIDMKKTVNKCQNIDFNEYQCKIDIEKKDKKELIIWMVQTDGRIELKNIKNNLLTVYIGELDSLYLKSDNNILDIQFYQLFGFYKKYHFDQYRFLVIISLCNQSDTNNDFIKELVDKIIRNSKEERKTMDDTKTFYKLVLHNLLSENIGAYDNQKIYRSQILNRLAIDCAKNYQKREEKIVDNQPFQRNEIIKTITHKTIQNELFIVTEWNRKDRFLIPQNTVIINQTQNWNIGEIEKTLEKLVKSSPNHSYEIILYIDYPNYLRGLEKIVENVFFNFDRFFKIKVILNNRSKMNLSEMQKLLIMTNFMNSVSPYFFLVAVNSWFPPKYMDFIDSNYKESDKIIFLKSSNVIHLNTGHIHFYEANTNKLYEYFIECIFPVIEKNLFKRINYRILGGMNKIKDLKNFMMKNGTINELKIVDYFDKNALHVFDS
jgi:hypothetical protein